MDKTEPTFVPEWLKSSGGLNTTSHHLTSSSLNTDEQSVSKSVRNKSLDNDLGRTSVSDRTTSSYFRRSSISNGSAHLRSYSSFGRNHRDKDYDKDIFEFRNKEKSDSNRIRDYSDPLSNILPSRFEKDGLRRSHSSLSGKRVESWPKKVVSDVNIAKKSAHNNGSAKMLFERDFPSLGTDEKQVDSDIGRVPSPGLSSAIQSLPTGNSGVIGGDGWTSALAEVPVIVGSNGNGSSVAQPVQPISISATTSMTGGRNMAETLAHGPPRTQIAPQVTVGTQRLEELAVKQSRQLIPMTPSMPKALALNSHDKPKLKVGQPQLQSSHLVNHPHNLRPVSVKSDVSKTPTTTTTSSVGGKLLVLKPSSRERNNGMSPTAAKESLSPTGGSGGGGKLPNSPLAVPSSVVVERKPGVVEKRPSSQAQSRNNFFNLMRKKSMTSNSSSIAPDEPTPVAPPPNEKNGEPVAPAAAAAAAATPTQDGGGSDLVKWASEAKVDDLLTSSCTNNNNNGKNHSGPDAILSSEEEEARFLRSLGWDETAEEEEGGLTEEEISSFYRNYMKMKPGAGGTQGKQQLLMPMKEISATNSPKQQLES